MRIVTEIEALRDEKRAVCLAIGFFDGVHRGHQEVIRQSRLCARQEGGGAWVLTFDTHPLRILKPDVAPSLLTCTRHKMRLLERMGVDGCVLLPFTREFAGLEPEAFVDTLALSIPTLRRLFVGRDWRFGRDARGRARLLRQRAAALGVAVQAVPPVAWRGKAISSTRIRRAVQEGRLAAARAMLGRAFSVLGTVVEGRRLGRTIGFPTANLDTHDEVWPPYGVYAVHALIREKWHAGVVDIGVRPTVVPDASTARPSMELHVLDAGGNLYGKDIEVFFEAKLRDERRFKGIEVLRRQIGRDIARARPLLAGALPALRAPADPCPLARPCRHRPKIS